MTRWRKLATLSAIAAAILAAGVTDALPHAWATSDASGEASRGTKREAGPEDAGFVDLQRQVNDLRSELLDERERRMERQLEANGAVLVVLGIVIGVGGLWFCARLRAIAAEASIGAAVARGYVPAPDGLLPGAGSSRPPPGAGLGPLRLLGAPGPPAGPDTVARANGNARASSVGAPRPEAPGRVVPSDGLHGPAFPAPDDDVERREEAIADCTEAIRLDPRNPRLYLERAGIRSELDRHEEAIGDYDRAIRLEPDLVAAYLGRCHSRSQLGRHEEAIEDYDHLVRLDPEAASAVAEG